MSLIAAVIKNSSALEVNSHFVYLVWAQKSEQEEIQMSKVRSKTLSMTVVFEVSVSESVFSEHW